MKVLVIGGSRNIGYLASQRLLKSSATVIFLLRNTSCFDEDASMKQYIDSRKARLVKGDALKEEDVCNAWNVANDSTGGPLDAVLFSVGGTPKFSVTKGAIITPPDLCARSLRNLLSIYPRDPASQPKLVVVSSAGLGKTAHAAVPLLLKPLYGYGLATPHADKLSMERALRYAAGWEWLAADSEPDKAILPDGWQERLGPEGWLKQLCVVRPPLLTNGDCVGDKSPSNAKPYCAEDHELEGCYTISRKDVAHFIVTRVLADWQNWNGKCVRISY